MARVEDVTGYLIRNTSGPGDYVKRVQQTKPAFRLTPSLEAFLEKLRAPSDKTIGRISNTLAYARAITGSKPSYHTNMIRLIKGGNIQVCEVAAPPPAGSNAHRETPYNDRFYFLKVGHACPTEIEPSAATFQGVRSKRKRRRR
ncbi:MAG: hypothetical protein JO277_08875 [Candidatus Eremiobacteraeota bacterium]|nr:hypothetical protein [Candidatus Eremiobacteraeota bacterium]